MSLTLLVIYFYAVNETESNEVLCQSTQELLKAFEKYNVDIDKEEKGTETTQDNYIIGSMEAVALYPSLRADKFAEIIREEAINSKVIFENVEVFELDRYLRIFLPDEYIKEKGHDKWLPTKVGRKQGNHAT